MVVQAGPAAAGRLPATLAAAFYDDPVFAWLLPDDSTRERRLRRFFAIEVHDMTLASGAAWTTSDHAGAALSLSPGHWRMPPLLAVRRGRGFAAAFGPRLPLATALLMRLEQLHLRTPHYYFATIGVIPERQGQGIGSALMRPTLERCDRERVPAYLEASSEGSARLYRRLGFADLQEFHFRGSPPIWLMVRLPSG